MKSGPVAQLAEQWTENLAFCAESLTTPSAQCERLRHKTTISDAHNVNMPSTASLSRVSGIANWAWVIIHSRNAVAIKMRVSYGGTDARLL